MTPPESAPLSRRGKAVHAQRSPHRKGSEKRILEPPQRSSVIRNSKKKDDVRDGKFFHVRVTVGYLTALRMSKPPNAASTGNEQTVSAYASFGVTEEQRGEYDCATSLPVVAESPRQIVKWPKGTDVKTSKRRLYHTVVLRTDDATAVEKNAGLDDDESTAMLAPSLYAPELATIYVGLKKGDESVAIGMATLVVSGQAVKNQKIDLPVKKMTLLTRKSDKTISQKSPVSNNKKSGGLSKFFGGGKRKEKVVAQPAATTTTTKSPATFSGDPRKFTFDKNATLKIKLDVMEGVYQNNGPGLWGDLEDDEESFGPVPVIDIPEDCTSELTDRYKHESIEVMPFRQGTTIISSPGNGEAEEKKEESGEPLRYKEPTEIEEFFAKPATNRPFYLCGAAPIDVMSEMPMTSSVTEEDDDTISEYENRTGRHSGSRKRNGKSRKKGVTSRVSALDINEFDGESDGESEEDVELHEATRATNTLLHYASRLGVPVEELLDADSESEGSDDDESDSFVSSRGQGTTIGNGSSSYRTNSYESTIDDSYDDSESETTSRYRRRRRR